MGKSQHATGVQIMPYIIATSAISAISATLFMLVNFVNPGALSNFLALIS
jgi:hypothetical protein